MTFLKWLESIRTPFFDSFFSLITKIGEETLMIVVAVIVLWCLSKKKGLYLILVGFFGLLINQFIKIAARIPRPWVKDPTFTIVESAREMADGYSFPSGHTQVSVGLYGCLARITKSKMLRAICIILAAAVAFSRMYLGVHTPWDVLFSVACALALIFGFYPIIDKYYENVKTMNIIFLILTVLGAGYVAYVSLYDFPADMDAIHLADAIKYGYTMTGAVLGVWVGYIFDKRFINYDTNAVWWAQIIKVVGGVTLFAVARMGLKAIMPVIFGTHPIGEGVRYFITVFVLMGIWPMIFRLFPKAEKK